MPGHLREVSAWPGVVQRFSPAAAARGSRLGRPTSCGRFVGPKPTFISWSRTSARPVNHRPSVAQNGVSWRQASSPCRCRRRSRRRSRGRGGLLDPRPRGASLPVATRRGRRAGDARARRCGPRGSSRGPSRGGRPRSHPRSSEARSSRPRPGGREETSGAPPAAGATGSRASCRGASWTGASAGRGAAFISGRRCSHTRFRTACMSRTPLVIAMTASCSGITMQYWPKAPSPR